MVLSLVLLTFLAVQIQQRMLRWRAERLLADMHQIRLYQSTWADAQRLMHRWGAWGHYDGSCTAESCKYEIEMDSIARYNPGFHAMPGLIGFSCTTDSISISGSADATQRLEPPSRFTTGPSGGKALRSASVSLAEGCEGKTISTGVSLLVLEVTRDFIGH
ncbi:hypothetical protein [Edaphobacter aggregans]|uniref:hypothetical protein n=1 Tax=Edaphobacter aggregans TaxID=570835 RepID=UPI0012F8CF27|nr:hypothetical protein [Edaphobacter aggregans]